MKNKPTILIDLNSLVLRTGETHLPGIGRTTQELISAFDQLNDETVNIKLFTQTFRGKVAISLSNLKIRNLPLPIGLKFDWLKENLPLLDVFAQHDLLHIPHNYSAVYKPAKTVITLHDALFFKYPEDNLGHAFARAQYPKLAKQCKAIATCSESSKIDIVHYLKVAPEKIAVIPWGVNHDKFYASDKTAAQAALLKVFGFERPYHVSVSCSDGRKNTVAVMRAFRRALNKGIQNNLVLVWGKPPKAVTDEFAHEINSGRLIILANVPDEMLRLLYVGATLTWFVSKYEGFGLPVLESMACGTPVVTCRNSSLQEAGGDAAIYVEPDDYDQMVDVMVSFDGGINGDAVMVENSLQHAAKFTWRETAKNYVNFYLNASQ